MARSGMALSGIAVSVAREHVTVSHGLVWQLWYGLVRLDSMLRCN